MPLPSAAAANPRSISANRISGLVLGVELASQSVTAPEGAGGAIGVVEAAAAVAAAGAVGTGAGTAAGGVVARAPEPLLGKPVASDGGDGRRSLEAADDDGRPSAGGVGDGGGFPAGRRCACMRGSVPPDRVGPVELAPPGAAFGLTAAGPRAGAPGFAAGDAAPPGLVRGAVGAAFCSIGVALAMAAAASAAALATSIAGVEPAGAMAGGGVTSAVVGYAPLTLRRAPEAPSRALTLIDEPPGAAAVPGEDVAAGEVDDVEGLDGAGAAGSIACAGPVVSVVRALAGAAAWGEVGVGVVLEADDAASWASPPCASAGLSPPGDS
jgi:hypothetical protein